MESSTILLLVFAFISVSASGNEKNNETDMTYPEATEVDAEKDIENKEIEVLKQKIADIVGEAFYNLTTAKDLESIDKSDSEFEINIASRVDDM
jgi:hypothetical protein